jgi:nucleoside-diphosphate-sugar epimerase
MFSAWFDSAPLAGVLRDALSSMSAEAKSASPDVAERAGRTLRAAEQRLLRSAATRGIACTLLRPTLIYDGGPDRSLVPIARLALRWRVLPIPLGASGLRQPVHAADLAAAVDAVIDCAAAHDRVYALGGGERLRFDRMLLRLRAAFPKFVLPLPLPQVIIRAALRMRSGRDAGGISAAAVGRVRANLVADNSEAARDFGYAPRAFAAEDVVAAACAECGRYHTCGRSACCGAALKLQQNSVRFSLQTTV